MKLFYFRYTVLILIILAALYFAQLGKDFVLGGLAGASLALIVMSGLGAWLARTHIQRIDKLTRDRLEDSEPFANDE